MRTIALLALIGTTTAAVTGTTAPAAAGTLATPCTTKNAKCTVDLCWVDGKFNTDATYALGCADYDTPVAKKAAAADFVKA